MDTTVVLKKPVPAGKTETGKTIFFWSGGFPASAEAENGNSLFQIKNEWK